MRQLNLFPAYNEDTLKSYLEKTTSKSISLVITDNSTSMLSMKKHGNTVSLRLHRIFLFAGSEVLNEIARFIKNSRIKTPHIRDFINRNIHCLKKKSRRKVKLNTHGKYHDLLGIFHSINREYFDGRVSASITWGSKGPRRAAARRTLGSYSSDNNVIRINPVLDSRRVPRYFLDFIVYHEMLHADIGIETDGKRRLLHSREFKRREKQFKHYGRAIAWEKKMWD